MIDLKCGDCLELVLDNCMGSGSTGVACKQLNRSFIFTHFL